MKLTFLTVLCLCLMVSGCSHKVNSIVGTWTHTDWKSPGNDITYVFKANGTFTSDEHVVYESIHSHQSSSGRYYVHNGVLTLTTLQETIGLDSATMAAIDAREKQLNPNLQIPQDKTDVPVTIQQPILIYLYSISEDDDFLKIKDTSNAVDYGVEYQRIAKSLFD